MTTAIMPIGAFDLNRVQTRNRWAERVQRWNDRAASRPWQPVLKSAANRVICEYTKTHGMPVTSTFTYEAVTVTTTSCPYCHSIGMIDVVPERMSTAP